MSAPFSVTEIASPLRLVRSDKDSDKPKQHHASTPQAEPTAITPPVSALHRAEHISRSLPDLFDHTACRPANEQSCNGPSCYTRTGNEGTPRLLPIKNGSTDLIPVVASDANTLDFPRRLPQQRCSASNITLSHQAEPTSAGAILINPLSKQDISQEHSELPFSTSPSSHRTPSFTFKPSSSKDSVPAPFPRARSDGAIMGSRTTENEDGSEVAKVQSQRPENGNELPGGAEGTQSEAKGARADLGSRVHVEKRTGATMVEAEPATSARSRKSSHMMQLFKDTYPEQHRGLEKKNKALLAQGNKHGSEHREAISGASDATEPPEPITGPLAIGTSGKRDQEDLSIEPRRRKITEEPVGVEEERLRREKQALADVTNQPPKDDMERAALRQSPHTLSAPVRDYQHGKEAADYGEDEDAFDKEQVSSAIYYPHKAPSPDALGAGFGGARVESTQNDHFLTLSRPEFKSPVAEREDPLHFDYYSGPSSSKASDSGVSSASDSEYSYTGAEKTPKATPAAHGNVLGTRTRRGRRPATVPVPTIELIPFKHQVGGHTILYKFHKKGVTKPLTNEENKFYELIELTHPELLEFMTGYVSCFAYMHKSHSQCSYFNAGLQLHGRDERRFAQIGSQCEVQIVGCHQDKILRRVWRRAQEVECYP